MNMNVLGGIRMNFDQIQTFITVFQLGNFQKASERLYVPQPTISHRINQLEKELGKPLILRGKGKNRLTREGEKFLPYAYKIIEAAKEGKQAVTKLETDSNGLIRIGSSNSFASYTLPKIILSFIKTLPNIDIQIYSHFSEHILEQLKNKNIELAITRFAIQDDELEFHLIKEEEIELIVSNIHPFASKSSISLEEILQEPLISFHNETKYREMIEFTLNRSNLPYRVKYQTNNLELIIKLLKSNSGVSFFPPSYIKTVLQNKELVRIKIRNNPFPSRQTYIVHNKKELNHLDSLFLKHTIDWMKLRNNKSITRTI